MPACFLCGHLASQPIRTVLGLKLGLCWRHEDAVVEVEQLSDGRFKVTATCVVANAPTER